MKSSTLPTIVAILIAGVVIAGAFIVTTRSSEVASVENVSIENGKQLIEITAKGQYSPKLTEAKARIPTVLRVETKGTFDCTSQLTVPSVGFRQALPPSGTTDIELVAQEPGAVVRGICAMGMYNFEVKFN